MALKWTDIIRSAGSHHPYYSAAYGVLTMIIGLELVISPLLLLKLVDLIQHERYKIGIGVLCTCCVFFLLVDVLNAMVSKKFQQILMSTTQQEIVRYVNQSNIDESHRGTWTYNTVEYAGQIYLFLDYLRLHYVRSAIFLLGSNILMWNRTDNWSNAFLLVQTAVVAILPWCLFNQHNYHECQVVNHHNDIVFDFLDDTFQHRKTVVAHGMAEVTLARLQAKTQKFFDRQDQLTAKLSLQLTLPVGFVTIVTFAVVVVRNIRQIRKNNTVTKYLLQAFQRIYHLGVMLHLFIPLLYNYASLLNLESKLVLPQSIPRVAPTVCAAGVSFHQVSFGYGNRPNLLTNCNFHFPPNSRTALIGKSGTGKTTVLNLIQGVLTPITGYISVPEKVGYVMQQPDIFNTTIWENVGYGLPELDRDGLEVRLKDQHLLQFLVLVGLDLDSEVGKNGDKLSGGQKQIVQLLRVLLLEPQILLLDEPTAALDEQRAAAVMELLCASTLSQTVIMVTHDPKAFRYMNRVIEVHSKLT